MVKMSLKESENPSPEIHSLMSKLKVMESDRVKSFKNWQYGNQENCSVQKMAEAGFYYSGLSEDDDSATCFVCGKVLDGWENTDKPWNEHEKHAPSCDFVQLHKEQGELTVEEFFDLTAKVIKAHVTTVFNLKMAFVNKRVEEISSAIRNQQV